MTMETTLNALDWQQSAWPQQFRDRTGFAVQVFPIDTPTDPARHLVAAARLAEELGFDAFSVGDHPAWALDPFVHLAAIAANTHRIRLGVNVCCALYRHPVMTARLAADVDNLSGGRLILGLGNGWDANEFANLGLPFPPARERQQALEEAITIMRGVWGDEPFTFEGQHFRCTNARVSPAPMQRPSLPIMIAGGGERVTLRQVARYADACNIFQVDPFGQGWLHPRWSRANFRSWLSTAPRSAETLTRCFAHTEQAGRFWRRTSEVSKQRWRATFQTESRSATRGPGDTLSRAGPRNRRSTIFARCEQPAFSTSS